MIPSCDWSWIYIFHTDGNGTEETDAIVHGGTFGDLEDNENWN